MSSPRGRSASILQQHRCRTAVSLKLSGSWVPEVLRESLAVCCIVQRHKPPPSHPPASKHSRGSYLESADKGHQAQLASATTTARLVEVGRGRCVRDGGPKVGPTFVHTFHCLLNSAKEIGSKLSERSLET